MNDLARRRQDLDEEVQRIGREMKRLRKQERRAGKVQVTAGQRNTARSLMAMRDGEPTAAVAFLKSRHTGEPTAAPAWVAVEAELQAWWRGADEATKNAHTQVDEANRRMRVAVEQAQRFLVDQELESWVADQNVRKGINPVPSLTLEEAGRLKRRFGVQIPRTRKGDRAWMRRWRRRMGLRLRKFPAHEPLENKDLHDKAGAGTGAKKWRRLVFFEPGFERGPKKGVRFSAAVSGPPTMGKVGGGVQKTAAFFS